MIQTNAEDTLHPVNMSGGITKREHFAIQALTCFVLDSKSKPEDVAKEAEKIADLCVTYADAIIKSLNKGKR